jgi:hypothetical protein
VFSFEYFKQTCMWYSVLKSVFSVATFVSAFFKLMFARLSSTFF